MPLTNYLSQEITIFYEASLRKKEAERADVIRLLDAFRQGLDVDVIYLLEVDAREESFVYTHVRTAEGVYNFEGARCDFAPGQYARI